MLHITASSFFCHPQLAQQLSLRISRKLGAGDSAETNGLIMWESGRGEVVLSG